MASLRAVLSSCVSQVVAATAGVTANSKPITIRCAVGWPAQKLLETIPGAYSAGTQKAVIGVYDRQVGRNVTRWRPNPISITQQNPTLTTAVAAPNTILPSRTTTITLGGAVTAGDAVSAVLLSATTAPRTVSFAMALGGASDTPETMATALAAAINGGVPAGFTGPATSAFASAIASGAVVTVTNTTADVLTLQSYVGNGAVNLNEIGRRSRQIQITTWSPTEEVRAATTEPIEVMLAQAEMNFGWALPDGSIARVSPETDFYLEDDSVADVLRRDFLLTMEYPITATEHLYAVLTPPASLDMTY